MAIYTPATAAKLVGVSPSSLRNYCNNPLFAPFFSAGATPPRGQARQLCDTDLRTLRFIATQTTAGVQLATVAERLEAGELETFEWFSPGQEPAPQELQSSATLALATALTTQLERARTHENELLERLLEAERRATAAETELRTLKEMQTATPRERLPFWHRLRTLVSG